MVARAPIVKDGDLLSESFKEWLRGLPCAVCERPAPSEPQHAPTKGAAGSTNDLHAYPTCRKCHLRAEGITVNDHGLLLSPISLEERLDLVRKTWALFFSRAPWSVVEEVMADVKAWRESRVFIEEIPS